MMGVIFSALSLKQKAVAILSSFALFLAAFGLGYWAGHVKGAAGAQIGCAQSETKAQKERAHDAETQRDIANAPPASLDDMLDWLSGDGAQRKK